ncbi:hypothetical protein BKA70DRAFT_1406140 [Coprinopsis sp. MPI-PUGE-AT-0042]|nr:hypothetical protein BKA70DRAFT_1406140 [Coprinopsis sp. MPI-PUGE-AT-0042]
MEPPTSVLPGIKKIPTTPHDELRESAEYVRTIYNPPMRGSRRRKAVRASSHATPSGDAVRKSSDGSRTSGEGEGSVAATAHATGQDRGREALHELRSDAFESNFAIRWLTSVVAYLSGVLEEEEDEEQELEPDEEQVGEGEMVKKEIAEEKRTRRETQRLLADAAALLAICAGIASAGVISCVFADYSPLLVSLASSPPTLDPTTPTIASTETSSCLPPSQYPYRGTDTGGACVMAEMVVEDPARFGLLPLRESSGSSLPGEGLEEKEERRSRGHSGSSSWELGRGCRDPHTSQPGCGKRNVEITATNYYPSVLENLEVNLQSNEFGSTLKETDTVTPTPNHPSCSIPNVSLKSCSPDWSTVPSPTSSSSPLSPLSSSNDTPLDGPFDMAFGADIVPLGAGEAERDDNDPNAYFHLIILLRSTHTSESGTIETEFGSVLHWQAMVGALRDVGDVEVDMVILEKETIVCEVEEGG